MTRARLVALLAAGATACAALTALSGSAYAGSAAPAKDYTPKVKVLDKTVAAPFQLEYALGSLWVADGGTSTISRLTSKGLKSVIKTPEGLAALGANRRGDIAYGIQQAKGEPPEGKVVKGDLVITYKNGKTRTVDLLGYDRKHNPDGRVTYGIAHPTPCQKKAFAPLGGARYKGQVDSHPYAVQPLGDDAWVVADAGGNDLLKVDGKGRVSTIAVLPRQPARITAAAAKELKLPKCVVGALYNFESVPTDVEVTDHGFLVTLLPGGPEGPSLGARGSVNYVNWRGETHTIAKGFAGATNLAVDGRGNIYVAELFGGKVSKVHDGKVSTYVKLANALSLEWARGTLYAGTLAPSDAQGNPTGKGTIVAIR